MLTFGTESSKCTSSLRPHFLKINKLVKYVLALLLVQTSYSANSDALLEEIVVTAQKRAESVQDVPISITTFTADAIRSLGIYTNPKGLALYSPNLRWKGSSTFLGNELALRGIASNSFGPEAVSTVSIYYDEVIMNNSNSLSLYMFDIERTEVLRGPQGTLYGRNTTGGAVNFHTRKPEPGKGLHGDIRLGYGTFDRFDAEGGLGFDLGETMAARIAFRSNHRDGIMENKGTGGDGSAIDANAVRGQVLWEPNESISILGKVHYSHIDHTNNLFKQAGLIDPLTFGPCANPGLGSPGCTDFFGYQDDADLFSASSDLTPKEKAEAFGASLRISWSMETVELVSITAYEDFNNDVAEQDVSADPLDVLNTAFPAPSDHFSQELRLASNTDGKFEWMVGAYFFTEDLKSATTINLRGFGPGAISGGPNLEGVWLRYGQDTEAYALFGQGTYQFNDQWSFTAGLRWTWEDKSFVHNSRAINIDSITAPVPDPLLDLSQFVLFPFIDNLTGDESYSEPSWRVALDYKLTEDAMIYASISESFKSGIGNSQATFDPNEGGLVQPEFLMAYEIGLKSTWLDNRLRFNASAFYYDFSDQQITIFAPPPGGGIPVNFITNAGESRIWGSELEMLFQATENLGISLNVGLLDAEFEVFDAGLDGDLSGNTLPSAPDLEFNGFVRYEMPIGNGTAHAQFNFSYTDGHFLTATNNPLLATDDHWVTGLRAGYRFLNDRMEIAGWVTNLLNEEYITDAFDVADFGYYLFNAGAHREAGVEISFEFD